MKKHILCFGDSNTHGYCPDSSDCADGALFRFNEDERYPCRLQAALGSEYHVIEEGLSGRTTVFDDPLYEGLSGLNYIYPCLKSHEPLSLLIIMLGTNDTKPHFSLSAPAIARGMERLVTKAMTIDCWGPGGKPNILVIAPPPLGEELESSPEGRTTFQGCVEKSRAVPAAYKDVCRCLGIHFLDASEIGCTFNKVDFTHLTRRSHKILADYLAKLIPQLVEE